MNNVRFFSLLPCCTRFTVCTYPIFLLGPTPMRLCNRFRHAIENTMPKQVTQTAVTQIDRGLLCVNENTVASNQNTLNEYRQLEISPTIFLHSRYPQSRLFPVFSFQDYNAQTFEIFLICFIFLRIREQYNIKLRYHRHTSF